MISSLSPLKQIYQTSRHKVIPLSWSASCEGATIPGVRVQPAVRLSTHTLCTQYTQCTKPAKQQQINPNMKIVPLELTPHTAFINLN